MTANEEMTVELTFDWSSMPDSSRDFSIVVWRTDRLPVSIEPETPLTAISFPLTWRPDYDVSDQSEPEAESCQGNPADAAFASWYGVESFPITTPDEGFCGWNTNSLTTTSGSNVDVYFIIRAACNVPWRAMSYVVTLTQPQSFWDGIKISSSAKLMESFDQDGQVTKRFHIDQEVDYRIAFSVPSSIPFPDPFATGENMETRETTLWQPPSDEWTRTPVLGA